MVESVGLGDIEPLIRSTSTILSIVNPQQDREIIKKADWEKPEKSMSRQLDRIALLFITEDSGYIAAIAASMTPSGVEVVATTTEANPPSHEKELVQIDSLRVSKNSETQNPPHANAPKAKKWTPRPDWELECLQRPRLGIDDHAAQLQFLITLPGGGTNRRAKSSELQQRVRPYIYFQCLPKLRKRFFARLPDTRPKYRYFDFICSKQDESWTDFSLPAGHKDLATTSQDDTWLKTWFTGLKYHEVQFELLESGRLAMVFNDTSARAVWRWLKHVVIRVLNNITTIGKFQRSPQSPDKAKQNLDKLKNSLSKLGKLMQALRAACNSNTVHKALLGKDIRFAYDNALKYIHPSGATGETVGEENDADEDDDLENEPKDPAEPTSPLREWLKSITQWEAALITLGTRKGGLVSSDNLTIRVVPTLTPAAPGTQSTISQALEAIPGSSPDWVRDCRALLAEAAKDNRPANDGKAAFKALSNVASLDSEWTGAFYGHVHCEASLVSRLKSEHIPYLGSIGVSKRCCYTCSVFLSAQDKKIVYSGSHGKVYPWASPRGTSPEAQQTVLYNLQNRLLHFLDAKQLERKSRDSKPESDSSGDEQLVDEIEMVYDDDSQDGELTEEVRELPVRK